MERARGAYRGSRRDGVFLVSVAGLYVHVPFCARACPYCDFDFEVGALDQVPAYLQGIAREAALYAQQGWGAFDTIYLGGGTPTILEPAQFEALREAIEVLVDGAEIKEFSVEFNPEHHGPELLAALRELGVDRLSLGVQSFQDKGLTTLGRAHRAEAALRTIEAASAQGFQISCDLMVGWPGQSKSALEHDLQTLIGLELAHISIYAMTVEEQSAWPKLVRRGQRELPDPERQAECLEQVERALEQAGYLHYEIASYAKNGALARHNSKYWSGQDYLGLGPSAHSARHDGRGGVERWGHRRGLQAWLQTPHALAEREYLRGEESAAEALWLSLRRLDGVQISDFLQRCPQVDASWLQTRTQGLRERALLLQTGDRLQVAPGAWLLHDSIAQELL